MERAGKIYAGAKSKTVGPLVMILGAVCAAEWAGLECLAVVARLIADWPRVGSVHLDTRTEEGSLMLIMTSVQKQWLA
jgi:hypothetical protein